MSIIRSFGKAALLAAGISSGAGLKAAALQIAARAASRAIQKRLNKGGYSVTPRTRIGSPARQNFTTRRLSQTKEDVSVTFNGLDENGERVSRVIAEWNRIPHDRAVLFSKAVSRLMGELTEKLNTGNY